MYILALATLALTGQVFAVSYSLTDNFVGNGFFSGFSHQAIADPTHGRVTYVSESTARSLNLTFASDNPPHFIIRADARNTLNPSGPGRNSVRLSSYRQWSHNTVLVADILHMPQGCATWPALWSFADPWPNVGEIDIVEGVNDQSPNHSTLHTTSGCTQPSSRSQTGSTTNTDCNYQVNNNAGCGVTYNKGNSYGPGFNNAGGGWYALERTPSEINVWFWSRRESGIPSDVTTMGSGSVNPANWGTPVAKFVSNSCPISSKFGAHNVIINLTLCGDWAGQQSIYQSAGCPGTCVDYVNNNPGAFTNAFWDLKALRMYGR